ncbi:MAG: hypothetical protein GXY41_04230 [Phycisphaerae bacterium]|nr:hypothetical protein [Phycisphaerae bacterium]
MKNCTLILLFALLLNGIHAQSTENQKMNRSQNSGEISYLTIEQSLLSLTDVSYFVSGDFPFNRINPKVKEYLLFYLENDNSFGEITDYSLRLLGYVAGEEDLPYIDKFIQTSIIKANAGNPNDRHAGNLLKKIGSGSGCMIGMMVNKEIKGARELLNKYVESSVWLSGSTTDSTRRNSLSAHRDFMVQAFQYSMEGSVLQAMESELSKGRAELGDDLERFGKWDTDMYTKSMRPVNLQEEDLQRKLNDDLLKKHRGIEPILMKITFQQWIDNQEKNRGQSSIN